jgi:hypothetical protein
MHLDDDGGTAVMPPAFVAPSNATNAATSESRVEDDEVEATEVLPPMEAPEEGAEPVAPEASPAAAEPEPAPEPEPVAALERSASTPAVTPTPAQPPASPFKWVAIGGGVLVLGLLVVIGVLVAQMKGGDDARAAAAKDDLVVASDDGGKVPKPEAGETGVATQVPPEDEKLVEPPKPSQDPVETVVEPPKDDEKVVEKVVEPPKDDEKTAEPPAKKTTKPAAKPIDVVFLVEGTDGGKVKVGRKSATAKNHAAYLPLAPGKYSVKFQAKGSATWDKVGSIKVAGTTRLTFRIANGKISKA